MPNWAEGVLKIRGAKEDVQNFLENGLKAIDTGEAFRRLLSKDDDYHPNEIEITKSEWHMELSAPEGLYIIGTSRAFIEGSIDWWFSDRDTEIVNIEGFHQAWGVDANEFAKISETYNIDIRIYVFESGMQFNQDIEIHKGEIIKNNEIKFDDYEWECIFSKLGG